MSMAATAVTARRKTVAKSFILAWLSWLAAILF
jgi:hypothetical protein